MDPLAFAANVGTAFLLGLLIGLERELRRHEAGLRTNALVALGAALFVSLSRLFDNEGSPTRVAGQVASGIGFLAGGVIIRDGFSVRGLTTAATLWVHCSHRFVGRLRVYHPGDDRNRYGSVPSHCAPSRYAPAQCSASGLRQR